MKKKKQLKNKTIANKNKIKYKYSSAKELNLPFNPFDALRNKENDRFWKKEEKIVAHKA